MILPGVCGTLFDKDSLLSLEYNLRNRPDGKWNHMMDQTHIGYTYWQEPRHNNMPAVTTLDLGLRYRLLLGCRYRRFCLLVARAGDTGRGYSSDLQPFSIHRSLYRRLQSQVNPFSCTIRPGAPWIQLGSVNPQIEKEQRVWINIDWARAPSGQQSGADCYHRSDGTTVTVGIKVDNRGRPQTGTASMASSKRMAMSPWRRSTIPALSATRGHPMADHSRPWPHRSRYPGISGDCAASDAWRQ